MRVGSAIEQRYRERSRRSQELWSGFQSVLIDGNTRELATFPPHPLVLVSGAGPRVRDADGHEYFDLVNNYTSHVHGNAHPELTRAAMTALSSGTAFPAPHELQARHAAMICERLAGAQAVRYTNSGTEAAMLAVRVARAATGRDVVAKARFGYHGSWEQLAPNALQTAGGSVRLAGVPHASTETLRLFEYNDVADLQAVCLAAGPELAAIIVEPMLGSGGAVPATAEFLSTARRLADKTGAALVIDEVQTFRLAPGGLQSTFGVTGDLTVLGKLIGGGFPIGAVAGRRELLEVLSAGSPNHVKHTGTFNGNLVSMAAGIRAMELLTPQAIENLNAAGEALAAGLRAGIASSGLAGTVSGKGSIFNVHLGADVGTVRSGADTLRADSQMMERLHLALLNNGVFSSPRGFLNTSTAITNDDVTTIAAALKQACRDVAAETA